MRRMCREVYSGLSDIISTEICQCRSRERTCKRIPCLIIPINLFSIVLYCFARDLNLIKSDYASTIEI